MEKKKLKIAFLSRFQGTIDRGVETFVRELSKRLSKNYQVDILSGSDADDLGKVISGKYDVVIPTNGRWQALKVSFGRMFSRYKIIISGQSGTGIDDIFNVALVKPDVFVAITDYAAWGKGNTLRRAKTWAWGTKVVKIPNGVDLDKFSPNGEKIKIQLDSPIILSVGALQWYKHHELTIEAVAKMNKGSLVIIGNGPKKEELEKLGKELLGDRFSILNVDYDNIAKYYRSADIFTLPSWGREAFGIVYIEALASGLPVVAPDDATRREIIGDAGIFTDVWDLDKYAKAIEEALKTNWGDKLRKQAEKFSWEKVAHEYENLFEDLKI